MQTITKNISTQLMMLAVVLGVLSCGEAEADDRSSGLYISIGNGGGIHSTSSVDVGYNVDGLIPGAWQIDREFLRRKGPGDLLKVTVTKARWNGQDYVAYLLVEWGNLRGVPGFAPGGPSNWDGVVKVDDGVAYVVKTISFEQPITAGWGGLHLTPKQAKKLAKIEQELAEELAEAELERAEDIDEAYDEIHNRAKLARKLAKIESKFDEKVAEAQEEYDEDLAKLLAKAQANNVIVPGDELIATGDEDKVKWLATVNGGADGVLIKLILDDDDADITVKAGGLKIKFETTPQFLAPVAVRNTGIRITGSFGGIAGSVQLGHGGGRYGGNRVYGRGMRYYGPPPRYSRYFRNQYGSGRSYGGHRHSDGCCSGSTTVRRGVNVSVSTGGRHSGRRR